MSDEVLLSEQEGRALTFTINRPEKLNSLNPEIMLRLGDTLNEVGQADEVRAVVIRGAGDKAFSSGYDIGRIPEEAAAVTGPRRNPLQYGLDAVMAFPYPVIAMIQGYALGGGLHLALACDLRLASRDAQFAMPPVKLGLVYPIEGYQLFVNLLGPAAAKAIFLTGRRFSAEEALHLGLIHQAYDPQDLEEAVYALARELAEENAPLAVKGTKLILNRLAAGGLSEEEMAEARRLMARAFQSEDAREARAAFAEKRKPQFTGR